MKRGFALGAGGSALLLICALLGATTASAAAPEFGRCIKLEKGVEGAYSNAGCTTKASGSEAKYKWSAGAEGVTFTSEAREVPTLKQRRCEKWAEEKPINPGHAEELLKQWGYTEEECVITLKEGEYKEPVLLETVYKSRVECTGETGRGSYTGPKTVGDVVVRFTGCEYQAEKSGTCQSPLAAPGEIVTNSLDGELGIIKNESQDPAKNQIGLRLQPETGTALSEFTCDITGYNVALTVTGSVIHPVQSNKMLTTENERFSQHRGHQKPENFYNGENEVLYTNGTESGESLLTKLTNTEAVEVNSVV